MADPANGTYQMFESIKQVNPYGSEYWSARDLMPLLGYDKWQRAEDVIERARVACGIAGQTVEHHFTGAGKTIPLPKGAQREVKDDYLSRFACYLIAMNGDPRKPEIASAQAYFAVQTRKQELFEQLPDMEKRALGRERVVDGNKSLSQTAHEAGVRSHMFGVFHDAGYKGLYGGLGIQDIKEHKGIGEKEDILDRMGRAELAANEFRITQTEQKLKNKRIQGEDAAIETHRAVGREVRNTIPGLAARCPRTCQPSRASAR